MIGFGIYLIGVIIAFIIARARLRWEKKTNKKEYSWGDALYVLGWALLSWAAVASLAFLFLVILIVKLLDKVEWKDKPPKWM